MPDLLPEPFDTVAIDVLDPAEASGLERLVALINHVHLYDGGPADPIWYPHTFAGVYSDRGHRRRHLLVSAPWGPDGAMVDVARVSISLPVLDNLHRCEVDLDVHPDFRRRGVGSLLLAWARTEAVAGGRRVAAFATTAPVGEEDRSAGFAKAAGARSTLDILQSWLPLPSDDAGRVALHARIDALEAAAASAATGYRIVTWQGAIPAQYLDDRAAMAVAISTDAPSGEQEIEAEVWDPARVLEQQERAQQIMRRTLLSAGAIEIASGRLVAITELLVEEPAPHVTFQNDTLVLGPHRGHRLGWLVKIANLRQLLATYSDASHINTWNAGVNDHMLAINRAMGFEPVIQETVWELVLDAAEPAGR